MNKKISPRGPIRKRFDDNKLVNTSYNDINEEPQGKIFSFFFNTLKKKNMENIFTKNWYIF